MKEEYTIVRLENVHGREERRLAEEVRSRIDGIEESFRDSYISKEGWALLCDDPQGVVDGTERSVAIINKGKDGRIYHLRRYEVTSEPEIQEQREIIAEYCKTTPAYIVFVRGDLKNGCMQWTLGPPIGEKSHYLVCKKMPVVSKITEPASARERIASAAMVGTVKNIAEGFECIASDLKNGVCYATRVPKEGAKIFAREAWKYGHLITQNGKINHFLEPVYTAGRIRKQKNGKTVAVQPDKLNERQVRLTEVLEKALKAQKHQDVVFPITLGIVDNTAYHKGGEAALLKWRAGSDTLYFAAYMPEEPETVGTMEGVGGDA